MKSLSECKLYTFVDTAYLRGRDPVLVTRQLCEGGSDLIQVRAKNASVDDVRRLAETIAPITERSEVRLVINDHPEVARAVNADFCHLGQEDFFDGGLHHVSELAPVLGPRVRVGLSSHAPAQARRAIESGASYIAIGPVYRTDTKPEARPVTLDYVQWAVENVSVPWFAIGGITLENLPAVLGAGARRICVVSAILLANDVRETCREFRRRLDGK